MKSDYRPHALMQNPQKWAWRTLSCRDPRKMGVACRARTISFTTSTNKACHVYVRRHTQCLNICVPCPLIAHVFFLGGVHERLLAWHDMKDVASVWHEHMRARHAFSLKWSHVGMGCMCSDIACVDMIRHVCVGCKRARAGMTRRVMPARSHSQPTQTRRAMSMCAATRNVWKYVCHAHWSPTFCLGRACGHDTPWRGFCLARARAGTTRLLFDDRQWAKGAKKKRSAELVEAEHPGQEHATRAQKHAKIREYGAAWLHHWERDTFKDWMHKQISEDLWWNEGLDCPYLQVRYVLKGKFSVPWCYCTITVLLTLPLNLQKKGKNDTCM